MRNTTQQQKAQQRREQFAHLLREMFQLNQPELDFGLYRIMHARKDDINHFIDKDLPRITQQAFSEFASQDKTQLEQELEKARKAAVDAGFPPEDSPKVQELSKQLKENFDLAREEGEVYDALITFFNRYYDEGDFLSRRVYKDGTYAIPYQGEEVVLHWANKDQYYIKSSENLRDYTFRLNPNAGQGEDPMRVHFKLVDADPGAKDSNKEAADKKRVFILDGETPFELIEGEPLEDGSYYQELQLRFHFRAATGADWTETEKKSATSAAQKNPPSQEALHNIAVTRLLGAESALAKKWKSALGQVYRKADGENAEYSMLAGQLNNYTKKKSFDYFIHKDLGGFLTRELDFYIKNELLDWGDLAGLKNDPSRLGPVLSKIEVIRSLGEKIITFLAQLENFQKKLWLKKKFVTETNYCITLDRLVEHPDLLETAFSSKAQRSAWQKLYQLDLTQFDKDCKKLTLNEFLNTSKYRFMMVDTSHFGAMFKNSLASRIDNIDSQCNGLLIHAENFQALNLLQERYRETVKCIYLDPPYNTSSSSIPYKNDYQHSAWATLMNDRIIKLKSLLPEDGAIFVSIDKTERTILEHVMDSIFGEHNKVEELIWAMNTNNSQAPNYSTNHEYVLVYAKNKKTAEQDRLMFREPKPGYEEIFELINDLNENYPDIKTIEQELNKLYTAHKEQLRASIESEGYDWETEKNNDPWKGIYNYSKAEYRDDKGNIVEENRAEEIGAKIWIWQEGDLSMPATKQSASTADPNSNNWRYYQPIHPQTKKPTAIPKSGWKLPYKFDPHHPNKRCFELLDQAGRISWGENEEKVPRIKRMLHEVETNVGKSIFTDYSDGEKQTSSMFGISGMFLAPKHSDFVSRFILQAGKSDSLVMDCFSGSGSTGHAVIKLNKADRGSRKFILAEMGDYFDTVLKPRIIKAIYSQDWRSGSPIKFSGVSQLIKTLRLESYEDSLGNLALSRSTQQQQLLSASSNTSQESSREAYILNYLLDVETRESPSLLNTRQFVDPTRYVLNVRSASGDETRPVNVDLLETFNYLLGLNVEHIAAPIHFQAKIDQGEYGRWQASVKRHPDGPWWFRTVYGTNRNGQHVLVVWRNLPSVIAGEEDGLLRDNAVLDAVLIEKLAIRLTESQDDEIDILYINGDHNINIPRNRKGEPMEHARIQLIEEAFHRLMFADTETPSAVY